MLVVAGKGHETGQIVGGETAPFDDIAETGGRWLWLTARDDRLWTSAEIAAATGGRATAEFVVSGVSIDTRTLETGDLFVALRGDRDGHDFLPAAFAAGARGALAERAVAVGPSVIVPDRAEGSGGSRRGRPERAPSARRAAVTGSVGKTSVVQAVRAGLAPCTGPRRMGR